MSSNVSSMVGPVKNVIIMRKDILCVVIVQSHRSELKGFRLAGGVMVQVAGIRSVPEQTSEAEQSLFRHPLTLLRFKIQRNHHCTEN